MKYFLIDENNSGGSRCSPFEATIIAIADSREHAINILESKDWYTEDYCPCCGERWTGISEIKKDGYAHFFLMLYEYVIFIEEDSETVFSIEDIADDEGVCSMGDLLFRLENTKEILRINRD